MTRSAEEIYHEARQRPPGDARVAYLDGACGADAALRASVDVLLKADAEMGSFLQSAAPGAADPDATLPQTSGKNLAHSGATLPTESAGQIIGRFKLLQQIGEGGFGSVWMAQQRDPVVRKVALKIIKLGMDTRQVIARFEAERQALALMDHPNIAKVLDAGSTETGRPYFVMELCTGNSITEYCDKNNLSIAERLELFAQVCQAVQHAHRKGLIHRDIKPSNILVATQDGRPHARVIDFGIAKATGTRLTEKTLFTEHKQLIGTPQYMSPEQADGSLDIDTRTDVYSLGVLLYELLTGTTPFDPKSLRAAAYAEIQRIIREVEPPKPSTRLIQNTETLASIAARRHIEPKKLGTIIRGELDWIVMKCLEKDRQRRYESANGLAMDIRRYLTGEAVLAAPPSTAYRLRKFVRRNRGKVIAAGVVTAALVLGMIGTTGGLVWALNEKSRANDEAAKATRAAESETKAKLEAQDHEQRAIASAAEETKARKRAETVSEFVTTALKASDAVWGGSEDMTILAAMDNAVRDINSGRFKNDPESEAGLQDTIANILWDNGRADKAEPLAVQALATRKRLHDGDHYDVGLTLKTLGDVWFAQGRFAEAETMFAERLAMERRLHSEDHVAVATALDDLAQSWQAQGRPADAERLYVEALEMSQRLFKGDHERVAQFLNNLAAREGELGRLEEAEQLFVKALEMDQRLCKGDHPFIVTELTNLGRLKQNMGRFAEAESVFAQALEMNRRLHKGDHAVVVSSILHLAGVHQARKQNAEARPLLEEALAMLRRLHPQGSPLEGRVLWRLGSIDLADESAAAALPRLEEAVAIGEKYLPPDHPHLKDYHETLAACKAALAH